MSRVARGERKSAVVEKALADEVRLIREHLNNHENNHNHDGATPSPAPKNKAKNKPASISTPASEL